MIAAYDGLCALCDCVILADIDELVLVDGEWVHVECAEVEEAAGRTMHDE